MIEFDYNEIIKSLTTVKTVKTAHGTWKSECWVEHPNGIHSLNIYGSKRSDGKYSISLIGGKVTNNNSKYSSFVYAPFSDFNLNVPVENVNRITSAVSEKAVNNYISSSLFKQHLEMFFNKYKDSE